MKQHPELKHFKNHLHILFFLEELPIFVLHLSTLLQLGGDNLYAPISGHLHLFYGVTKTTYIFYPITNPNIDL